ncbi:MAG: hypothetical protein HN509_00950 [Halobacteriovoraceae bacterium]|nr:hypothetical protein [Halobacteriovoraceae bacterium]MBT5094759.1 hypothetical protein [Halobacteriovoraceae bacterium]
MNTFKWGLLAILLTITSSCSGLRRMAVGTTSPLFVEAGYEMQTEASWDNFKLGVLGNLKLMEGMLYVRKSDENLLATLAKGYSGYAFAINETQYLKDKLAENDKEYHKNLAIMNYSKGLRYGLRWLLENDISYKQLQKSAGDNLGIEKLLDSQLGDDTIELETVLFSAQALASLINLQKTNLRLVAQLSIAKGMFDWVCKKRPDINFGTCSIFYGSYEAGRPKMLGGNPQKGKEIFKKLIAKNPHNWLARAAFIEYYIIPMSDEKEYKIQKLALRKAQVIHNKDLKWSPASPVKSEVFAAKEMRFFQALGLKRFQIIRRFEKDIF